MVVHAPFYAIGRYARRWGGRSLVRPRAPRYRSCRWTRRRPCSPGAPSPDSCGRSNPTSSSAMPTRQRRWGSTTTGCPARAGGREAGRQPVLLRGAVQTDRLRCRQSAARSTRPVRVTRSRAGSCSPTRGDGQSVDAVRAGHAAAAHVVRGLGADGWVMHDRRRADEVAAAIASRNRRRARVDDLLAVRFARAGQREALDRCIAAVPCQWRGSRP